ncbi:MAG TPA: hypothetical protein PLL20_12655 [Phycisphaerae bacterium]|nr:hypothetical protein [Phycisphaerae bacterium]
MMTHSSKVWHGVMLAGLLAGLAGCSSQSTRIHLTTYDETGREQHHYADFNRVAFLINPSGLLELGMRVEQPSKLDPTQTITQLVHIKEVWKPVPGRTAVERTQINVQVRYGILTPPTGVRYDGAGFLYARFKEGSTTISGEIESGRLAPSYRMADAMLPFGVARISGPFRAVKNPGEVIEIARQLDLLFSKQTER